MLLGWTDNNDGKHKNGCFYRDGMVPWPTRLKRSSGKWTCWTAPRRHSRWSRRAAKGTFLNAAAELGQSDDPNISHILSATEAATASVGETDGKLHLAVHVTAQTPSGVQIKKILDGLAAFGLLATHELPRRPK